MSMRSSITECLRKSALVTYTLGSATLLVAILLPATGSQAATTLVELAASPDRATQLDAALVVSEALALDTFVAVPSEATLPGVPRGANLVAAARDANGDWLLSFDVSVELPASTGTVLAGPGDAVRLAGGVYSLELERSVLGVRRGASIDALSFHPEGYLLSFDVAVDLGTLVASDADVVLWNGSSFSGVFDAAAEGVARGVDTDGVHHIAATGLTLMSFDVSGELSGTSFSDEDVTEFDPVLSVFLLSFEAAAAFEGWRAADLDALFAEVDSDDDGLSDSVETDTGVFVDPSDTGTDPLLADSDGDGLDDGFEVLIGSDPNVSGSMSHQLPALSELAAVFLAGLLLVLARHLINATSGGRR